MNQYIHNILIIGQILTAIIVWGIIGIALT